MPRTTADMSTLLLVWGTVLAVGWASATGCATTQEKIRKRRPGATKYRITAFVLEGVEAFEASKIKSGLATRVDPGWRAQPAFRWIPLLGAEHSYFNKLEWRKDLQRIRVFYKSRGYFDVQIVSESVIRNPEDDTIKLKLVIDEGKPTDVESVKVDGLEPLKESARQKVLARLPLKRGKTFEESRYLETKSRIVDRLESRGYAYAEISGKARIFPDQRKARVRYIVDPGPKAVFGKIRIEGLETIPKSYIRSVIDIEKGQPYSARALQEAQQNIYGLEVFSLVSVLPAHQTRSDEDQGGAAPGAPLAPTQQKAGGEIAVSPTESDADAPPASDQQMGISNLLEEAQGEAEARTRLDPKVPVVIQLEEARNWNVRLGTGLAFERNRQDVHGVLDISSRNFFGGLRKFQFLNTVGYAWAPGFLVADDRNRTSNKQGIIWTSKAEFVQPWLTGGGRTNFRLTPSVQRDIQIGYKLWNPSARIGVDRSFTDHISAGIGYRLSYYNFDEVDRDLAETTPLGEDFQEEFLLEFFEQNLTFDYRDNPLDPRRGFLAELTVQEAARYIFGGEFNYLKATTALHGYIPFNLWTKWVMALRLKFGVIYNLEGTGADTDTQQIPTISRFDSGGRNAMRSFGRDSLSIYQGTVPVGGATLLEMSVEPRFRLVENLAGVGDLWSSIYLDAATVERGEFLGTTPAAETFEQEAISPGDLFGGLLYGVGAGIWWVTPIGPVRLDFAYTISDIDDDPRFRLCEDGTSAALTGNCNLQPKAKDDLFNSIAGYNFIIGIGHSF